MQNNTRQALSGFLSLSFLLLLFAISCHHLCQGALDKMSQNMYKSLTYLWSFQAVTLITVAGAASMLCCVVSCTSAWAIPEGNR